MALTKGERQVQSRGALEDQRRREEQARNEALDADAKLSADVYYLAAHASTGFEVAVTDILVRLYERGK
jgi:hypothetical protein